MARKHRRRNSRRYKRNPTLARFFNPVGNIVGRITTSAKEVASFPNLKKAGAVVGTIALAFVAPAKLFPRLSVAAHTLIAAALGILATAGAAMGAPAFAPAVATGALSAVLLRLGLSYLPGSTGIMTLNGFLTRAQLGQIPAGLLAPGQLKGFLETTQPFSAMGPMSSHTLGSMNGERFSNVV